MLIRGGDTSVTTGQMAQALRSGEQVVIARRLNAMAVASLENELSLLTGSMVSVVQVRGRYVLRFAHESDRQSSFDPADLDGQWTPLDEEQTNVLAFV